MATTQSSTGKLEKIYLLEKKGEPRKLLEEAWLEEGMGLRGDAYAGPGDRQIPIYCSEGRKRLASHDDGLCFARFLETLCFSGIDTAELQEGDEIDVGDAVLGVSRARKKCYPECPIVQRGDRCDLSRAVRFCTVRKSGSIHSGSSIEIRHPMN